MSGKAEEYRKPEHTSLVVAQSRAKTNRSIATHLVEPKTSWVGLASSKAAPSCVLVSSSSSCLASWSKGNEHQTKEGQRSSSSVLMFAFVEKKLNVWCFFIFRAGSSLQGQQKGGRVRKQNSWALLKQLVLFLLEVISSLCSSQWVKYASKHFLFV